MHEMKGRKLNNSLIPVVIELLKKEGIQYEIRDGKVMTTLSSNQYHYFVTQAKKILQQGDRDVAVLTCQEALLEDRPHCFEILQPERYDFIRSVN